MTDRRAGEEVLLVEDDPRFAALVTTMLRDAGIAAIHAPDARSARRLAHAHPLRAILLDLGLPDANGARLVRELTSSQLAPILVLSGLRATSAILEALRAGASGYLLKEDVARRLVPALDELRDGGAPLSAHAALALVTDLRVGAPCEVRRLTDREADVLQALSRGLSYEQVAQSLGLSINTVRTHVTRLYGKLDASTRTEAVMAGVRLGLVPTR